MLVVHAVFQAKFGRVDEVVVLFQELKQMIPGLAAMRVMTDASGGFFRVITQTDVPSLAEWHRINESEEAHPDYRRWMERLIAATDSGYREYFTIMEQESS